MKQLLDWRLWTPFATEATLLSDPERRKLSAARWRNAAAVLALVMFLVSVVLFDVATSVNGFFDGQKLLERVVVLFVTIQMVAALILVCLAWDSIADSLTTVVEDPKACKAGLLYVTSTPRCADYRDEVLASGRQLYRLDVDIMARMAVADAALKSCRALHGLAADHDEIVNHQPV